MIGVFDSGVGGLSVLRQIRIEIPDADLLYVADRGRAPYGLRPLSEVRAFSHEIAEWLLARGASTLVVACNTASAAALDDLRSTHHEVPIVGMEPAVKPAALSTKSRVIAVFATAATFQGRLFESVVSRFTEGVEVIPRACPKWVEIVEDGQTEGEDVMALLESDIRPVLEMGADTVVLGCTHFSFLRPAIEVLVGPEVTVIDPANAVARQTARVAPTSNGAGSLMLAASGDLAEFTELARRLADIEGDDVGVFP